MNMACIIRSGKHVQCNEKGDCFTFARVAASKSNLQGNLYVEGDNVVWHARSLMSMQHYSLQIIKRSGRVVQLN